MAIEYAVVTGRITPPGSETGLSGRVEATPLTKGEQLHFPADGRSTIGPATADVAADGTLSQGGTPGLKIPKGTPAGTLWQLVFYPKGGASKRHTLLGVFDIRFDIGVEDLVPVEVETVTTELTRDLAASAIATQEAAKTLGHVVRLHNRAALQPFWDDLDKRATQRVNVVVHGDSLKEGVGASTWAARPLVKLQKWLRDRYPIAGVQGDGWIPALLAGGPASPITVTPNTANLHDGSNTNRVYGLGGKAKGLGDNHVAAITRTGTQFRVWYGWFNDGLTANGRIRIDGGAWQTVLTADATPGSGQYWTSPVLAAGSHLIEVSGTTLYLQIVLEAIEVFGSAQDRDAGVHVYDGSHSSWTSSNLLPGTEAGKRHWEVFDALDPSLLILDLVTNDPPWGVTAAMTAANLRTITARAACPALVLIPPRAPRALTGWAATWEGYRSALLELAAGNTAVYEWGKDWPVYSSPAEAAATGLMFDDFHPNDAGHDSQAAQIGAALVRPQPEVVYLRNQVEAATTAQLASLAHPVNTYGKFAGRQVFNTTTGKPVWAAGSTPAALWKDSAGATAHTPA